MLKASSNLTAHEGLSARFDSIKRAISLVTGLYAASLQLRLRSLQKIVADTSVDSSKLDLSAKQANEARQTARFLETYATRLSLLCLPQAVALRTKLAHKQIPSRIHFGFLPKSKRCSVTEADLPKSMLENARTSSFLTLVEGRMAHAWVSIETPTGRETILGHRTAQEYTPIAYFD